MGDWDHADEMDQAHWDDWAEDTCPKCGSDLILPTGRPSDVLILIDAPFDADYNYGAPITGQYGSLLETELGLQKMRMRDMRRASVWMHKPNGSVDCYEYCIQRAIQEASKRKVVLLVGAEVVKTFTGFGVDSVSGLVVKSNYLPTQVLVACPSPKTVFSSSVGEIRFALTTFKREIQKVKESNA